MMSKIRILCVVLVLGIAGGCAVNQATVQPLRLMSTDEEIALGDRVAPELERRAGGLVRSEEVQGYVQMVGQRVAAVATRRMPYRFHVLDTDTPNAFALPGGRVYITAGLLSRLHGERQLAAVLANQVGHVCTGAPVKALHAQMGSSLLSAHYRMARLDMDEEGWRIADAIARRVLSSEYTRRDEQLADAMAIHFLARAGYNPWGVPEVLSLYYEQWRSDPRPLAALLDMHPVTLRRMKLAKVRVETEHAYFRPDSLDPGAAQFASIVAILQGLPDRPGHLAAK